MKHLSIAVLITCHNRRDKTLASLASLFNQVLSEGVTHEVYLVDDGSTDGTADAVRQAYPDVKIIQGNGNLFWNGGMRVAFESAVKTDHDYHLWLNDDTLLYPEALKTMVATSSSLTEQGYDRAIVTGSTCDPQTGVLTYGGMVRTSPLRPLKFSLVEPEEVAKRCDTINGNCVLVPREVVQLVGNLDPGFSHYLGDFDYGLRSQQLGCTVWVAPGYIGTCSQNAPPRTTKNSSELGAQLKKMAQPKGLAVKEQILYPFEEWKVFAQRHGGILWPIYWLIPYRRLLWLSLFGGRQEKGA